MLPTIEFLGIPTDTYALCMLLSVIVVFITAIFLKPREIPLRYVIGGLIIVTFFAFLGANLLNIIIHVSEHKGESVKEAFLASGLSYLGAPLVGLLMMWAYCRIIKVPFLVAADFAAPFFALERIIGRLGCLGYGCCYGTPSDLPWAYPFYSWGITHVVPRHPTQAYALIAALAIFASSIYLYRSTGEIRGISDDESATKKSFEELKQLLRDAKSSGVVFLYVVLCYSVLRFINEFLRAEGPFLQGPFKFSHAALSLFALISAIGLFVVIRTSSEKAELAKVLRGALARLCIWLVAGGTVILFLITLIVPRP